MATRGTNLPRLGDFNQRAVLDAIRRHPEGISRVELGQLTGLTGQTISNITRRLLDDAVVGEGGRITAGRGKPRTLLQIRPERWHAVGVHIDPAQLTVLSLDLSGRVRARLAHPTPDVPDPEAVVRQIATMAAEAVAEVEPGSVLGLGVAAPGPIDAEGGRLHRPPQLPGWQDVALRADLHRATGWPVLLDKDVTAAVTGEHWSPEGTRGDFLYLYLGSGIAAGAVVNGAVHRGRTNNAGEVGEILTTRRPTSGDPRQHGKLHSTVMPEPLVRRARKAGLLDERSGADVPAAFAELCRLADTGDRRAVRLLRTAAADLTVGAATLLNFLDLDTVVVGGPAWPPLERHQLPVLAATLPRLMVAHQEVQVRGSRLAADGAAQGAAALVLEHFLAPRTSGLLME
ncbi:ROK family transcriptional regulator [Desertihabitans aurantiacus]|uniref:ROK family transcriptional regulator n=1 Tax=Desertihabitans aurantiacus TaxID=2282477 RepID=UPI000DF7DC0F|nr:ROK family transcriptional regulator [Desertihabitans aurantiacus]